MATIWKTTPNIEVMNGLTKNTMDNYLGIEYIEAGDDFLLAKMPVDHRTKQPMGILHGGANVVLAESMGSFAAVCCIDPTKKSVVGVEINANHLKSVRSGFVFGKATPVRIGRSIHVWRIEISDEKGNLTCVSRITVAILDKK